VDTECRFALASRRRRPLLIGSERTTRGASSYSFHNALVILWLKDTSVSHSLTRHKDHDKGKKIKVSYDT